MTLKRNTSFIGVKQDHGRARAPIQASDWGEIAADQALVHETLTHKNADGSGGAPPTNVGHSHKESGNLLYWSLCSQMFGTHVDTTLTTIPTGSAPYLISSGTSPTAEDLMVLGQPVFIPVGWENKTFVVLLECNGWFNGDLRFSLNLLDSSLANVTGYEPGLVSFDQARAVDAVSNLASEVGDEDLKYLYAATFSVSSAGLYIVRVRHLVNTAGEGRTIHSLNIFPAVDPATRSLMTPAKWPTSTGTNVQVGDPNNSNAWHPIDSAIVADNFPHGPIIMKNGHNGNLLQELATGWPAAGNASLTVSRGHDHRGSGNDGKEIERMVAGWCFGSDSSNAAIDGTTNNSKAIRLTSTSFKTVLRAWVRTPQSANNSSGTSKLKCAIYCRSEDAKATERLEVRVIIGGTTVDYVANGASGAIYKLLTSASAFAFTSGGQTSVEIQARNNTGGTPDPVMIFGVCLYFDQ